MTLITQEVRAARGPAYWRAWIDAPAGVSCQGRSKAEALGELVILITELQPGRVVIETRPPAGDEPAKRSGRVVVLSGEGGAR